MPAEWIHFPVPVPIDQYDLKPGAQIEVEYTYGLAANPQKMRRTFLIGEANSRGGQCECCSLSDETDCVVLAERVLINPDLLEE